MRLVPGASSRAGVGSPSGRAFEDDEREIGRFNDDDGVPEIRTGICRAPFPSVQLAVLKTTAKQGY